ncbi:fungal pheromone mating factor STE2 GPCR-domain-containing protein [Aspergillus ambiguus]|uniref:alpha-factor pheromone receptor STE2 n=1 Tax=Aspergillus ambiguus TaxID=176160 RepID=UPI003CCE4EDD
MGSSFDPFLQNITLYITPEDKVAVPVEAVDSFYQYCIRICINYGSQLGACIVLFIILLLLTRPEKRGSSVFLLNTTALLLNVSRLVCQLIYFTSDFVRLYAYFGHDFSRVPLSAYVDSVLGVILVTLLIMCIQVSLVLQAHVVCANLRRRYRTTLLVVSTVVALVPTIFRFVFMVQNCYHIMHASETLHLNWLESATNAVITVSICFFAAVFITKLGFAIHLRKRLGMTDFGPMKVIFVMGCQTMAIPAILSILQYVVSVPELASNILTLVTISLPLSSIWAGFIIDQQARDSGLSSSRNNLFQALSFSNGGKTRQASTATYVSLPSSKSNTLCYAKSSAAKQQSDPEATGIAVERDISIHSCRKDTNVPSHV